MYTRSIHRMHFLYTRNFIFDGIPGQLVNEFAKGGILLRRSAYDCKWPNRVRLCVYFMNFHDGKRMNQTVIA
ncbi:hypothetical protein D3C71_1792250 [compost metagenome]